MISLASVPSEDLRRLGDGDLNDTTEICALQPSTSLILS